MTNSKTIRLSQAARELNVGHIRMVEFLRVKGHEVENSPNAKITEDQFALLKKEFAASAAVIQEAHKINIGGSRGNIVIDSADGGHDRGPVNEDDEDARVSDKGDAHKKVIENKPQPKKEEDDVISANRFKGPKVIGKIELDSKNRPIKPKSEFQPEEKPVAKAPEKPAPEEHPLQQQISQVIKPEIKVEPAAQEIIPEKIEETKPIVQEIIVPKEVSVKEEEAHTNQVHAHEEVVSHDKHDHNDHGGGDHHYSGNDATADDSGDNDLYNVGHHIIILEDEVVAEQKGIDPDDEESLRILAKYSRIEEDGVELIEAKADRLKGLKVVGKIDLPVERSRNKGAKVAPPVVGKEKEKDAPVGAVPGKKKKRKRVKKQKGTPIMQEEEQRNAAKKAAAAGGAPAAGNTPKEGTPATSNNTAANSGAGAAGKKKKKKDEVEQQEVDIQLKKTLAKMSTSARGTKTSKSRYKREKRRDMEEQREIDAQREQEEAQTLKLAEFISTSELARLMDVEVNEVIMKSINMGMFISINQRLDAEAIALLADDFGFAVEFKSAEEDADVILDQQDAEADLKPRAPIVTIMGHVDHGKTSLLDYIRKTKVVEGEAGGITQHIGAYDVTASNGRRIVFLDTPGHEAFTAMRARGAKVTDVAIIVIAADDSVMPQTIEAINHAHLAGVPYVIAFNKVDKPTANVARIKEQLANINVLVDSWGGKVQTQEISAKTGMGVDDLLELVLLESDIMNLKANPSKRAVGTVIEAALDKGKGYVATMLVQAGTLNIGDIMLVGTHYGRVKAMTDHRAVHLKAVGPATPVQVLGLNGAPQAGDKFNVMESEREAREIASRRGQIMREQSIRATKRTTLSEIGRRIALGSFHQLNIIIKGDVDGSVEALSDSLQKLSTEEVQVNILYKAVGPISESDVLLASASDAIVIGFQVRPVPSARKLIERESVELRMYSIIYEAINDVKAAMEGLLSPDLEETIVGNAQISQVFKIAKVGTVAGCRVLDGYLKRNSKIRVVRDGIVVHGGEQGGAIDTLKRFKDDVSEVRNGFECGISVKGFNDIREGDIIEAFEVKETKRKLA